MRRILNCAGVAVATAVVLIGLAAGPAHAMTACEGAADGTVIIYAFGQNDGSASVWMFECYDNGKGRFVDGY